MKKTVIALFASLALVLGMGTLVSSANAAPYPNTVKTTTKISAASSVNEAKSFKVIVRVKAGNAHVGSGRVRVVFAGTTYSKAISGGITTFYVKAPSVSKTTTKILKARYVPEDDSVYQDSSASKSIKVKNKKKK